jgi:hypothetical protein
METKVVNKKSKKFDVFIGRPSKWGNPYKIGVDGTREQVIEKYRKYLLDNNSLMNSLPELVGKRLGCFCKPLACHGDVLVQMINLKNIQKSPSGWAYIKGRKNHYMRNWKSVCGKVSISIDEQKTIKFKTKDELRTSRTCSLCEMFLEKEDQHVRAVMQ